MKDNAGAVGLSHQGLRKEKFKESLVAWHNSDAAPPG